VGRRRAARNPKRPRLTPGRRIFRHILLSGIVALLTGSIAFAAAYLLFPVSGVEVRGATMLPESEVKSAVGDRASLLTLNAEALERRVEANPWVYSASVSRDWDSSIVTVQVEERRAVLNAVVEGQSRVYSADGTELPGTGGRRLPELRLDRSQVEEVLRGVGALRAGGLRVHSVDSVDAGGVSVTVGQQRVIFTGEVREEQVTALRGIMDSQPGAEYFDLRSSGRVVVGRDEDPER
jgi:hypothetical protein